ncbi:phosphoribosyltransferase [Bosea sp. F3-2]|uniref:phosphoribosyltransferase n=1 Tax=Bosea sp. F3-2 TaxID=2599640 RepID=UPI0011ED6AF0|nr:phosphoribosyltransferase [Bosea sp. F3-2]QEL26808.1 phosphoribosyltransferase [Bosea sp. F3-2]
MTLRSDIFSDRRDAGRKLANRLRRYRQRSGVIVLALPRGGVPVGFEVAQALKAPLDVLVVRKLGVPGDEEMAMGAIATAGARVLNRDVIAVLGIDPHIIDMVTAKEEQELLRRERLYRGDRAPLLLEGRTVIVVDDGLATGATMRAAVMALREKHPARIVVAVPVGSRETCEAMKAVADEAVCATMPRYFVGVGSWYSDFSQTSDDEVRSLLDKASGLPPRPGH